MVDTPDSKSGIEICGGSSPPTGTTPLLYAKIQKNLITKESILCLAKYCFYL